MMRKVIRDYFAAFRWQKIKDENKTSLWMVIYFTFILPLLTLNTMRSWEGLFLFELVIFPVAFCLVAEVFHPITLPKIMYLCPMSREMRREYIEKAAFFRIAVPLALGILAVAVLLLSGRCDWLCGAGILLNDITFCVCIGLGIRTKDYGTVVEIAIIVTTLLVCFIYSSELTSGMLLPVWGKGMMIGVILFISGPITARCLKGWRGTAERAVSYESSYREREKTIKNRQV